MSLRVHAFSIVVALTLALPELVHAQCSNLTGNPVPQPEQYAANLVKLKYLATGPGFGDDRPEIQKSLFNAPSLSFEYSIAFCTFCMCRS